jgi:peptidoglycan/LPS O-acetylase OafA/YrhL
MLFYQIFTGGVKPKYLILLGVCLTLSLINGIDKIEHLEEHYNTYFSPYGSGGIITLFYLLMFVVATGNLKRINSPKLLKLGMLTYPLYLIHQNIGFIIFNNFDGAVNKYVLLSGTILLMLVISYLISEFYEPKVSQFLRKKIKKLTARFA